MATFRALVIFARGAERAAEAVARGLRTAGAEADARPLDENPRAKGYDLVLFGAVSGLLGTGGAENRIVASDFGGAGVSLFFVVDAFGKPALERTAARLAARGVRVRGTILLRRGGFLGMGGLPEVELARAEAFGERAANSVRGIRAWKPQEKARIPFYKK